MMQCLSIISPNNLLHEYIFNIEKCHLYSSINITHTHRSKSTSVRLIFEFSYFFFFSDGPFDNSTSLVQSPSPLLTNGSMSLNFTCISTEVNPEPVYSWTVTCVSPVLGGNVCVYIPKVPDDDGKSVGCSAISQYFDGLTLPKTAYSRTNMNLQCKYTSHKLMSTLTDSIHVRHKELDQIRRPVSRGLEKERHEEN